MANQVFANFINRTGNQAKGQLAEIGDLTQMDSLWAGSPNYDGLITQAEIDEYPAFVAAGLTAQDMADVQFVLASIKNLLLGALPALSKLASLP